MAIIQLEDYKSYASVSNPKEDEKLQYLVDFVNVYIVNFCNTSFEPMVVAGHKITSHDGVSILLPNAPLISVEEVRNLKLSDDPLEQVLDPTTYIVDKGIGEIESLTSFPEDRFKLEVDYTHGYASAPRDLIVSGLEFITYLKKREFNKSRSGEGQSADYGNPELIPPHIRLAMNMYKVL